MSRPTAVSIDEEWAGGRLLPRWRRLISTPLFPFPYHVRPHMQPLFWPFLDFLQIRQISLTPSYSVASVYGAQTQVLGFQKDALKGEIKCSALREAEKSKCLLSGQKHLRGQAAPSSAEGSEHHPLLSSLSFVFAHPLRALSTKEENVHLKKRQLSGANIWSYESLIGLFVIFVSH